MEIKNRLSERLFNPDDLETAFRYKTDSELSVAKLVYGLIRFPWLVKVFSFLTLAALKLGLPMKRLLRNTIFKVFIAGETLEQAILTLRRLQAFQVHVVLDYVAEAEQSEKAFEYNAKVIKENIIRLSNERGHHFISLKLSGLADMQFMSAINDHLDGLGLSQLSNLNTLINRVDGICSLACINGIGVYIDAETYDTQKVYDRIAEEMMSRYNTKQVFVYNTLQMYLRDRLNYLEDLIEKSNANGYMPGIKLVRGAYMELERERAGKLSKSSPVWSSKAETDHAFDEAIRICFQPNNPQYTCLATHNLTSLNLALELSSKLTVSGKYLKFSQLYGMSDHLSFNLAYAGMDVSKYLPYGEIVKAVPYMLRRAEENSSIGEQTGRELLMIEKEYQRRKTVRKVKY